MKKIRLYVLAAFFLALVGGAANAQINIGQGGVVQVSLPTANLGPDLTKGGTQVIELDPGSGFYSYAWSTGETTQRILVMDPGTYSVTVSNGVNMTSSDTIVVMQSMRLAPEGQTVQFDGSVLRSSDPLPGSSTPAPNGIAKSDAQFAGAPVTVQVRRNMTVYPNPAAQGEFSVVFVGFRPSAVAVIDPAKGMSPPITGDALNATELVFDCHDWEAGIYYIKAWYPGGFIAKPVQVVH